MKQSLALKWHCFRLSLMTFILIRYVKTTFAPPLTPGLIFTKNAEFSIGREQSGSSAADVYTPCLQNSVTATGAASVAASLFAATATAVGITGPTAAPQVIVAETLTQLVSTGLMDTGNTVQWKPPEHMQQGHLNDIRFDVSIFVACVYAAVVSC